MAISPLAGKPAPANLLIDAQALERDYYAKQPDLGDPRQLVQFGTSGHRGTPFEATFTEAENLKKEMAELRTSYEARLAKTEAEAREQIQAQIREAQSLRTTLMAEAATRADDLVKKAELEIEAEKVRALSQIRSHVVDLTLTATERLIGENVDTKVNRKLVDEFIDKLAVTSA